MICENTVHYTNMTTYTFKYLITGFFNLAFQNSIFPVINRPRRVTKTSATIIDHILTNAIIDSPLHSGIVRTDISDHFAVFCLLKTNFEQSNIKNIVIKRDINEASIEHFKFLFNSIDWDLVTQTSLPNHSYNIFFEKFVKIYDQAFPERKFEIKAKNLVSPWITRGLRKSSRKKQRLYEKFLKQRNSKNEEAYKMYKKLFEKFKKQSKKLCFQNKLRKCENVTKNTWKIMKSIIEKSRVQNNSFPKSLIIANEKITDKKSIAEKFDRFFMHTGTNLAAKIPHSTTNFESYLPNITTIFRENCPTEEEFKNVFFSLKTNKSPGYDNIHVNVIRNLYNEWKTPLMNFNPYKLL